VTEATDATFTVIDDVPLLPSLVAVIVALPTATAVTSPELLTVAMDKLLEDQLTDLPTITVLPASLVSADSC
jgi:hypothetical protein